MADDNPPAAPRPWWEDLKSVLAVIAATGALITTVFTAGGTLWNTIKLRDVQSGKDAIVQKVDQVHDKQDANAVKLDDAKAEAATAAKKAEVVEKKVDKLGDKADKIGAKVGATGMP